VTLGDRPTPDLVVILLALFVGFVLVVSTIGVVVLEATDHGADVDELIVRTADITNTLIGALVGYLAGRGVIPASSQSSDDADT